MYDPAARSIFVKLCIYHHNQFQNIFIPPPIPTPFSHHSPIPPFQTLRPSPGHFLHYVALCVWLFSLSMMFSMVFHVVVCVSTLFLSIADRRALVGSGEGPVSLCGQRECVGAPFGSNGHEFMALSFFVNVTFSNICMFLWLQQQSFLRMYHSLFTLSIVCGYLSISQFSLF